LKSEHNSHFSTNFVTDPIKNIILTSEDCCGKSNCQNLRCIWFPSFRFLLLLLWWTSLAPTREVKKTFKTN